METKAESLVMLRGRSFSGPRVGVDVIVLGLKAYLGLGGGIRSRLDVRF